MINGDVNMFVDDLHYGATMEFLFKNKMFIVHGYTEDNNTATLQFYCTEDGDENNIFHEFKNAKLYECAEEFLKAPIFDGKTFWEVEHEIEWVD